MADPISLAMVGAAAGAVTNKKDPLKGALLGATLGGVGGAVAPGLLGGGAASTAGGFIPAAAAETQLAAAPASAMSGFLSKATSTPALIAGAQLAGAMAPQQARTAPMQMSQAKPVDIAFQPVPISQRVVGPLEFMRQDEERQLGAFDVPGLVFERMMPGYSVGEYRPARRM